MTATGLQPDPWQTTLLLSTSDRLLLLCSRQAGKSLSAAALALLLALRQPPALILLLSPTLRQSGELFRHKVLPLYAPWRRHVPPARETQLTLELANGSRIISLPDNEEGIRTYSSVALLVIDEAARVSEDLYRAVRPMLAVSRGRLIALSTPYGKRGWFYDEWQSKRPWERVRITADQCPRIPPEFLAEERAAMGDRWYRQEYLCSFEETVDAVFSQADIDRALCDDVQPLFGWKRP
jgi:Terminase large subunit, T4likevirus-type, N-terminal